MFRQRRGREEKKEKQTNKQKNRKTEKKWQTKYINNDIKYKWPKYN